MKEELITFETAIFAKNKGFDIPCKKYYGKTGLIHTSRQKLTHASLDLGFLISTQSLLQKWLREKHNIFISVDVNYCYKIYFKDELFKESNDFNNYEEALEKGLQEALKLININ